MVAEMKLWKLPLGMILAMGLSVAFSGCTGTPPTPPSSGNTDPYSNGTPHGNTDPYSNGTTTKPSTTTDPYSNGGTTNPGNTDPYSNGGSSHPGNTDPYSNGGSTKPGNTDPYSNGGTTKPGNTDPYSGGSTTKPGNTDPYANVTTGTKLNINIATLKELEALPGVGPVKAQAIIDYRTRYGKFQRMEDVRLVPGIGDATYAQISRYIVAVGGATTSNELALAEQNYQAAYKRYMSMQSDPYASDSDRLRAKDTYLAAKKEYDRLKAKLGN